MINFTIHGCCAGTEPLPGARHTSYCMEINGSVYWIDAGENCSYSAHLNGVDLLATRAIFITHPHMDHIGGLGNLFWNIRKLTYVYKEEGMARMEGKTIALRISELRSWHGIYETLCCTEGDFKINFTIDAAPVQDGEIFRDENMVVTAHHNSHLIPKTEGDWKSYSFVIHADGKKIVCCGDIRDYAEIGDVYEGADMIFVETGHHKVDKVCNFFLEKGYNFGKLVFVHNGRRVLDHYEESLETAKSLVGDRVIISRDGMKFSL